MADCPQCGDPHDGECRRQVATRIADHLVDHPEDYEVASLRLQMAAMQEQIDYLTAEVHQHWP